MSTLLSHALKYADEYSFSIIPAKERDKLPLVKWEEFQKRRPTTEEITAWWQKYPNANIALVTGKISGVTVVDVEKGGDISKFPLTKTIQSGGGGWHLYYKYYPIPSSSRVMELTDIRSDGGIIILPPSVHSSGNKYKVLNTEDFADFPYELFEKRNVSIFGEERNTKVSGLLNDIIPQGNRNDSAASVAGKLLLRFKEHEWEEQAWSLFVSWNEIHNSPPLPERELRTTFNSISQSELRRREVGADIGEPQLTEKGDRVVISVPITDGFAIFEFDDIEYGSKSIETVMRFMVDIAGNPSRSLVQRINILSQSAKGALSTQLNQSFETLKKLGTPIIISQAFELLEKTLSNQAKEELFEENLDVNTHYLIKPFIEEGVPNILFGMGGSGKTYLSLRMACSLALGKDFLGADPDKVANSLFVDYENTRDIWTTRITKILNGMGVEDKSPIIQKMFYFNPKGAPVHDIKYQLLDIIKQRDIKLVIIDSAALACGGEAESADMATKFFNALSRLKTTTFIIAHETKNSDNKNKMPYGSVFWYNCARNIWNVEKKQDKDESLISVGILHRKCNNEKLSGPRAARVFFGKDMVDINPGNVQDFSKEMNLKYQILRFLKEETSGESLTITEIAESIEGKYEDVKSRLAELAKKGEVEKPERGKYCLKKIAENNVS